MNIINLLSVSIETYGGFGMPYSLNWIGKIIQWLIEIAGSIGLGIILFTLALKLITLPLDIISRASMKKNNIKMRNMRPQLEKYQRQYANNKELYNKKIQALYKKEGFSMFASCLPTLVTLVFFIVVINQFSTYSNYTNLEMVNNMSLAYTQAVENYNENTGNNYVYVEKNEDGSIKKNVISTSEKNGKTIEYYSVKAYLNVNEVFDNAEAFDEYRDNNVVNKIPSETNEYDATFIAVNVNKLAEIVIKYNEKGFNDVKVGESGDCQIIKSGDKYVFNADMFEKGLSQDEINAIVTPKVMNYAFEQFVNDNVKDVARSASKDAYYEHAPSFLWIKNLWVPDLPFKHPVNSSLSSYEFSKQLGEYAENEAQFSEVTAYLGDEKKAPNGYFILVLLSIGSMLLSQIIMTKSQKDQMELQTVDGQGAQSAKLMMWMMPIMFGIFAFFYSASFSLYMTVSTLLSMLSTLIINYFVELSFKKKNNAQ